MPGPLFLGVAQKPAQKPLEMAQTARRFWQGLLAFLCASDFSLGRFSLKWGLHVPVRRVYCRRPRFTICATALFWCSGEWCQ